MRFLLALDDKDRYIHNDLKKFMSNVADVEVLDLKKVKIPQKARNTTFKNVFDVFKSIDLESTLPKPIGDFDLAFIYTERSVILEAILLGEYLEEKGILMYHTPKNIINSSHDKLKTIEKLKECNFMVPETLAINLNVLKANIDKYLEKFKNEFILKSRIGGKGEEVYKITSKKDLENAENELKKSRNLDFYEKNVIVQKFYNLDKIDGKTADLRVVVVGDQVLGAYWRQSNSWKTNISQGGSSKEYQPSQIEKETYFRTLECLGLHNAGIDVFSIKGERMINEVNVNFGYRGLKSPINPMQAIAELALKIAKQ